MGGGLMQLVAYGAQDIYLTGNPQITFFKVVYRRHTNFSMETILQTLNGTPAIDQTTSCTISRNGDLVHRMYVTSSDNTITNGSVGLVREAELEIGGQKIDKHYSEWMNVWNELSTPESKALALKSMQGNIGTSNGTTGVNFVQVPLQFWFCRNPGLALPLIALQYHEVKVKITWGAKGNNSCGINCDYIYLDTDERRRFAQVSHEYLIEQLQKEDKNTASTTHKLNFNHPVKELIWTTAAAGTYTKANLKLNGHDRFALQDTEYFQFRQPYECHTAVPRQNLPSAALASVTSKLTQVIKSPTAFFAFADSGVDYNTIDAPPDDRLVKISQLSAAVVPGQTIPNFAGAGTTHVKIDAQITNANLVAYHVHTDSIVAGLATGDICEVTVVGDNSIKSTVTCTVTSVTAGSVENIAGSDTSTIITFDQILTAANFRNDVTNDLAIVSIIKHGGVSEARTSQMVDNINVYSFALKPEEHQPSGTCNFSRIDNAQLIFETPLECTVYAVNYNVLRIMSGMGGLAYSN
jgi:hypothetical protein